MTELENVLPFSGVDPKGRVKFSVLLEMFQQTADTDAGRYGLSVRQTIERGVTWVLRKYRVELEKYPTKESGNITIKTYAEPFHNLYSLRSFKLRDEKGVFLGAAYTWWVLIDLAKRRPMRIDKFEPMKAFMTRITDELPQDVNIPPLSSVDVEETWKVRWQDLDVNNHTNHAVYFGWALDAVPYEVPENLSPMFVEGEFLRPIPRVKVRCLTQEVSAKTGRRFIHSLRHTESDDEYARIASTWL